MADMILHNVAVKVDNAAGSPTAVTNYANSVAIDFNAKIGKWSTHASLWEKAGQGSKAFKITLTYVVDDVTDSAHDMLSVWALNATGGARTFEVYYPDALTGSEKLSGEVFLESVSPMFKSEAGNGEVVKATAVFIGTGALAQATVA